MLRAQDCKLSWTHAYFACHSTDAHFINHKQNVRGYQEAKIGVYLAMKLQCSELIDRHTQSYHIMSRRYHLRRPGQSNDQVNWLQSLETWVQRTGNRVHWECAQPENRFEWVAFVKSKGDLNQ
jgi:hypothetical protein